MTYVGWEERVPFSGYLDLLFWYSLVIMCISPVSTVIFPKSETAMMISSMIYKRMRISSLTSLYQVKIDDKIICNWPCCPGHWPRLRGGTRKNIEPDQFHNILENGNIKFDKFVLDGKYQVDIYIKGGCLDGPFSFSVALKRKITCAQPQLLG